MTDSMVWHSGGCQAGDWRLYGGKGGPARAGFRRAEGRAFDVPPYPESAAKDPPPGEGGPGSGTAVITRPKTQVRHPNMYRVLAFERRLHSDGVRRFRAKEILQ